MSQSPEELMAALQRRFTASSDHVRVAFGQVTLEAPRERWAEMARILRDEGPFAFEQLIDVCGVDYSTYGQSDWETNQASVTGFSRGVGAGGTMPTWRGERFAVVYHLLSYRHNQRLRVRVFLEGDPPRVDSVVSIWNSADWFEREAFDLFGILFEGHPDLRRILTDYGFIGHPFRKDFPLEGNVEVRYDPDKKRVVYQPVSIENRVLVPRVIRADERYEDARKLSGR
ncbi:MAG: NADH-quinone oxidoreductase subunit C [Gammaproteobacteria bacterium]|nr:NADH-quinone oxidoreductase subunit C [Gammaproteobacteria bacterium]MCG3143775.1 NAD(P)H-quinone oxidoreductase subunit J, chloroplastic [Gammaproteobacteria bacterium]